MLSLVARVTSNGREKLRQLSIAVEVVVQRTNTVTGWTNAGGHMECASTPELANLGHLVYQLNSKLAFFECCLADEEKKVAELEVIN